MRRYLVAAACGFVIALMLAERWRRIGSTAVPSDVTEREPSEAASTKRTAGPRALAATTSRSLRAGVRTDLGRLRHVTERLRSSRGEDAPAATADPLDPPAAEARPVATEGAQAAVEPIAPAH